MQNSQTQTAEKTAKNQNKEFFRIHVKPNAKPYEAIKARVRDNEFITREEKIFLSPPEVNIHNFYTHKVIKLKGESGQYEGKFKFVDEYDKGGDVESIEIRYIANCPSLDKQWQIKNGFKPLDAKAFHGNNYPANSIQEFDMNNTDPLYIEFLKHHQGNEVNPQRDPRNGILFKEVDTVSSIGNKKSKFEMEKKKMQFIESIHESDGIVNIYSAMLGISMQYDIDYRRDRVLEQAEVLTTDGLIKKVNEWKSQYVATLNGFLADGKINVKTKKVYISKNPEPFFKDEELKSESGTETLTEIVEKMFTTESTFNEVKRLLESIK